MSFEKLEVITGSGKASMPVSVSLTSFRGGRPRCTVGVTVAFATKAEIKKTDKFDVLLGGGDKKGLLRLVRSKAGILSPKMMKGGCSFNLGYIEKFGSEGEPKEYCNASLIDADTIEIVLPKWSDEIED